MVDRVLASIIRHGVPQTGSWRKSEPRNKTTPETWLWLQSPSSKPEFERTRGESQKTAKLALEALSLTPPGPLCKGVAKLGFSWEALDVKYWEGASSPNPARRSFKPRPLRPVAPRPGRFADGDLTADAGGLQMECNSCSIPTPHFRDRALLPMVALFP